MSVSNQKIWAASERADPRADEIAALPAVIGLRISLNDTAELSIHDEIERLVGEAAGDIRDRLSLISAAHLRANCRAADLVFAAGMIARLEEGGPPPFAPKTLAML